MTDYEAIKDKVDELLTAAAVKFEVVNAGSGKDKEGWEHDAWRFTLTKMVGGISEKTVHSWTSDYRTGTGNRVMPKGFGCPVHKGYVKHGTLAWEDNEKQKRPVKPRAADVLYCILSDGQAADTSFHDWASDFGYDTDSLKALGVYNACCETGRELRKLFTREERAALEELTREM